MRVHGAHLGLGTHTHAAHEGERESLRLIACSRWGLDESDDDDDSVTIDSSPARLESFASPPPPRHAMCAQLAVSRYAEKQAREAIEDEVGRLWDAEAMAASRSAQIAREAKLVAQSETESDVNEAIQAASAAAAAAKQRHAQREAQNMVVVRQREEEARRRQAEKDAVAAANAAAAADAALAQERERQERERLRAQAEAEEARAKAAADAEAAKAAQKAAAEAATRSSAADVDALVEQLRLPAHVKPHIPTSHASAAKLLREVLAYRSLRSSLMNAAELYANDTDAAVKKERRGFEKQINVVLVSASASQTDIMWKADKLAKILLQTLATPTRPAHVVASAQHPEVFAYALTSLCNKIMKQVDGQVRDSNDMSHAFVLAYILRIASTKEPRLAIVVPAIIATLTGLCMHAIPMHLSLKVPKSATEEVKAKAKDGLLRALGYEWDEQGEGGGSFEPTDSFVQKVAARCAFAAALLSTPSFLPPNAPADLHNVPEPLHTIHFGASSRGALWCWLARALNTFPGNTDATLFAIDAFVRKAAYDVSRLYPRQSMKLWYCIDNAWVSDEENSGASSGALLRLRAFMRSGDFKTTAPEGHESRLAVEDASSTIRA